MKFVSKSFIMACLSTTFMMSLTTFAQDRRHPDLQPYESASTGSSIRHVEIYTGTANSDVQKTFTEIGTQVDLFGESIPAIVAMQLEARGRAYLGGNQDDYFDLSQASLTLMNISFKSGSELAILTVGYRQDDTVEMIDFEIPVQLGRATKNIFYKLNESGTLQLYFQLSGAFGFNNQAYGDDVETHNDEVSTQMFAGGSFRSGLILLDKYEIGGMYEVDAGLATHRGGRSYFRHGYGAQAKVKLAKGWSVNANFNQLFLSLPERAEESYTDKLGNQETYKELRAEEEDLWQAGIGLEYNF